MDRRSFIKYLGLYGTSSLFLQGCSSASKMMEFSKKIKSKPNIVIILADDMGYGDVGCYGSQKVLTPNIDKIAEKGIRFTDAHSPSAVCTPTRYGILTGRYCWRSRLKSEVLWSGYEQPLIESDRMTIASMLKTAGYDTACVGKWHVGMEWSKDKNGRYEKVISGPREIGFDYYCCVPGGHNLPPYCLVENDNVIGELNTWRDGEMLLPEDKPGWMSDKWDSKTVDLKLTEKSKNFIKSHQRDNPDKPFLLYHGACSPHRPCVFPDFVKGKSQAGPRGDMVTMFDWTVGQIYDCLKKQGIIDNTLIIITSDNGAKRGYVDRNDYGHKSCGDWRGFKADIWEGGHRVPFIAIWPECIPTASVSDELLSLTDLLATFAEIHNIALPSNMGEDSISMLKLMLGKSNGRTLRDSMVYHSYTGMYAIRKDNWILVEGLGSGGVSWPKKIESKQNNEQLFNLRLDKRQQEPELWKLYPEKAKELKDLLNKIRSQRYSRKL